MAKICCWRSGHVEVLPRCPEGAIALMTGPKDRLARLLSGLARHSRTEKRVMFVPDVAEAESDQEALVAVEYFQTRLERALRRRTAA